MNEIIWNIIHPYFKKTGNWGDWTKINEKLLIILYEFQQKAISPTGEIIICCGYDENKPPDNGHFDGRAVDFYVKNITLFSVEHRLKSFLTEKNLQNWVALGIYPHWGGFRRPGFHLEVEKEEQKEPRRWGAVYEIENGQQVQRYYSYTGVYEKIY